MEIAEEPVEAAPEAQRSPDNPLVRAVARIPLPLGAKLLLGFAVVGALLAVGYTFGVVALGQSNSRGEQLLRLQRRAVYLQVALTDAPQLQKAIEYRLNTPGSERTFGSGLDQAIGNDMQQLCDDSGLSCLISEEPGPFHLSNVDPKAAELLLTSVPLFYPIVNQDSGPKGFVGSTLGRIHRFATSFVAQVGTDARKTRARANELVAANRSSFTSSRNLVVGGEAAPPHGGPARRDRSRRLLGPARGGEPGRDGTPRREGRQHERPARAHPAPARARERAQVAVPRQHVTRAPNAAERDHRLQRGAARADVRGAERAAARLRRRRTRGWQAPALSDQRRSRPCEDRGRAHGPRAVTGRDPRHPPERHLDALRAGRPRRHSA